MAVYHLYARAPHPRVWGERVDVRSWKMCEALAGMRLDVVDVTKGPKDEEKRLDGVRIFRVGSRRLWTYAWKTARLLKRQYDAGDLQLIHAHRHSGALAAVLARKLFRVPVPIIFDYHDPWSGEGVSPGTGLTWSLKRLAFKRFEGFLLRNVDRVFVVTHFQSEILSRRHRIPRGKFTVIPNAADIREFSPARRNKKRLGWQGKKVVLFLGSVVPYFGVHLLVEAAPRVLTQVPDARFVIKGVFHDPEYRERILRLVKDLRLERHFEIIQEWLDTKALGRLLASADVAVILHQDTLLTRTASPDKVYEYLASGLPVVATDLPNLRELVGPGRTGLIIPVDAKPLADALVRLLKDDTLRSRMSRQARAQCEHAWNWQREMGRVVEIYRRLAKFPGSAGRRQMVTLRGRSVNTVRRP